MSNRIKTLIKFYKGLDNIESKLYGLVTKTKDGSWRGCRIEDKCKRKIVFVDPSIAAAIIPNVLYSCSLVPMRNDKGFIAQSAKIVMFQAKVSTNWDKKSNTFVLSVSFGNKKYIYDPSSVSQKKTDIQAIAKKIRESVELSSANDVAEDFISSACIIKRTYEQQNGNAATAFKP